MGPIGLITVHPGQIRCGCHRNCHEVVAAPAAAAAAAGAGLRLSPADDVSRRRLRRDAPVQRQSPPLLMHLPPDRPVPEGRHPPEPWPQRPAAVLWTSDA